MIANSFSLVVTIATAILRPILINRLIGGVAVCAFLSALHQVVTARFSLLSLLFTALLEALLFSRLVLNASAMKKIGRR